MKNSLKYFNLWLPCVYAMALSGLVLYGWSRSPISLPPGSPAFFAFLPMAFFFSALSTQNHVSRLERRIEGVEKKAGLGAASSAS
jgi:hypothetical protein